jgi:hypothetical protein
MRADVRREQSFNPQQAEAMKFEFVWELRIRISLKDTNKSDELRNEPSQTRTESPRTEPPQARTEPPQARAEPPQTRAESPRTPTAGAPDKYITSVTLQIVEIAFGSNVPPENKEKILGGIIYFNCMF